jgi:salicylate hydroxylase
MDGPNRSIVYYRSRKTFNWLHQPIRAAGTQSGWLRAHRGRWPVPAAGTIRTIIAATPNLLRQALYDREPLLGPSTGVLLGDAAHPMMPFTQGGAEH